MFGAVYPGTMNDAQPIGAPACTSSALKRRIPFLISILTLLTISGTLFAPSFAEASQGKIVEKVTVAKAASSAKKATKSTVKKRGKTPYVQSLMPAEERTALRDRGFSSGFGVRAISKKRTRMHKGIDVPAPKDSKIMAFNDGTVVFTGVKNGYGKTVIIKQLDGREALYAHMNKYVVSIGDTVKRGAHIGHVGRTGRATGFHLHFELIDDGVNIDPAEHVWHSAELVLSPGDLDPSTVPDTSVAQSTPSPDARTASDSKQQTLH
ncbi:MAG: hypothetical protein DELT_02099 [Desulfovibrio sp.]